MSILIGYIDNDKSKRLHIDDYEKQIYKNRVYCMDGHLLVGRKGNIMIHHYAHKKNEEATEHCTKKKGEWHNWQQNRILKDYIEVHIQKNGKRHLADARNKEGLVIEFQQSVISQDIIREREQFYDNMIWVFGCILNLDINIVLQVGNIILCEYLQGTRYMFEAKKTYFLDFGKQGYIEVLYKSESKIIGRIWILNDFDETYLKGILKQDADKRLDSFKYPFSVYTEEKQPYKCNQQEITIIKDSFFSPCYSLEYLFEQLKKYKKK